VDQRTKLAVAGMLRKKDLHPLSRDGSKDWETRSELVSPSLIEAESLVERLTHFLRLYADCRNDRLHSTS
jgi:hypothetical protein